MNLLDDQLDRLFRAAGKAVPETAPVPAYGLETRVLAAWRSANAGEIGVWDMGLLVRGLIVAGAIMVISLLPALKSSTSETTTAATTPYADFLQLADSTVSSDDAP